MNYFLAKSPYSKMGRLLFYGGVVPELGGVTSIAGGASVELVSADEEVEVSAAMVSAGEGVTLSGATEEVVPAEASEVGAESGEGVLSTGGVVSAAESVAETVSTTGVSEGVLGVSEVSVEPVSATLEDGTLSTGKDAGGGVSTTGGADSVETLASPETVAGGGACSTGGGATYPRSLREDLAPRTMSATQSKETSESTA
jgi:hypothetical protein